MTAIQQRESSLLSAAAAEKVLILQSVIKAAGRSLRANVRPWNLCHGVLYLYMLPILSFVNETNDGTIEIIC